MSGKVVTDYDSDWAVALQPFDSELFSIRLLSKSAA